MTGGCELLLVRHASSVRQGAFLGHSDVGLAPAAAAESTALAAALAHWPFDLLVSSDLRRCRETAQRLFPDRPIRFEPAWREYDSGAWTLRRHDELLAGPEARRYQAWLDDPEALAPPGGERMDRFRRRIFDAADALARAHAGQRILVVSHGGPIRLLLVAADPDHQMELPPAGYRCCRWPPPTSRSRKEPRP